MSHTLVWETAAFVALRQLHRQDPLGSAVLTSATRALTVDPRPLASRPLGGTAFRRLRVDVFRILYEVDDAARCVTIHSVGRVAPG